MWDNLNTHVSRAMRELIAARSWLRVYRLPPYASELNQYRPGLLDGFLAKTQLDLSNFHN